MRFDWDEKKRIDNIRKHGFDFADAWKIFTTPMLTELDDRQDHGEDRWVGIGMIEVLVSLLSYLLNATRIQSELFH